MVTQTNGSTLKSEHKRNLTVGFNANQQAALLNTMSGIHNDSLYEDEGQQSKPRHNILSPKNNQMFCTQPFNTKTFETLNSNDSLLGGSLIAGLDMSRQMGGVCGGLGSTIGAAMAGSFTSNLSKRLADAMQKHTSL